jgi:hypothetical protein
MVSDTDNEDLIKDIFWRIGALALFLMLMLVFLFGMVAIVHHFYPEDNLVFQTSIIESSQSQFQNCYLNGVKVNCSTRHQMVIP